MNLAQVFPEAQADESWMQTQWEGEAVKDVFRTRSMAREGSKPGRGCQEADKWMSRQVFRGIDLSCVFLFD